MAAAQFDISNLFGSGGSLGTGGRSGNMGGAQYGSVLGGLQGTDIGESLETTWKGDTGEGGFWGAWKSFWGEPEQLAAEREQQRQEILPYLQDWKTEAGGLWEQYMGDEAMRIAQAEGRYTTPLTHYLSGMQAPQMNVSGLQQVSPQMAQAGRISPQEALAQTRFLQPYMQGGQAGQQQMAQAMQSYQQLMQDPSQVMQTPGAQARFKRGQEAIESSAAARGMQLSGQNLENLYGFGQQFQTDELNQALQRAMGSYQMGAGASQQGLTAAGQRAQLGTGAVQSYDLANLGTEERLAISNQMADLQAQGMNQSQAFQVAMQNMMGQGQFQERMIGGLTDLGRMGLGFTEMEGAPYQLGYQNISDVLAGYAQGMTGASLGIGAAQSQEQAANRGMAAAIISSWLGGRGE